MPASRWHSVPPEVYALVANTPGTILLEGAEPKKSNCNTEPWTRLFTAPLRICTAYQPAEVSALFAEIENAIAAGFSAAGYFAYECGASFEPKAAMRSPRAGQPLAWFGIYDRPNLFDHTTGQFANGTLAALQDFKEPPQTASPASELPTDFALNEPDYTRHIETIHEWIRSGDVYQLNFTAPLRVRNTQNSAALYSLLRNRQPAQYGAFLHPQHDQHILSFSPELFFLIDHKSAARHIVTRPMKGTAPRGRTNLEDRAIADWLANDPKNRSENLMIVDLLRNDLGRIARFGTVQTGNLFAVERLSTLWQMTSTITAELRSGIGFEDIFRALFPCGSVTGAPKVRAMQLIAQIEEQPRGVYTGAIGFFSPQQTIFNVAIRTLEIEGDRGTIGLGSGIVIDSEPAAEYRECLLKARFLTSAADQWPQEFSLIETILWNGDFPLLDLHLDRLIDSAAYFDIPCDRPLIQSALEHLTQDFSSNERRRIRLLLSNDGALSVTHQILDAPTQAAKLPSVRISTERTVPDNIWLYHKTTHRVLYASAFDSAAQRGFADVLFFNTRGELTEGAISNVFIEKDGRWYTPPIECGLLPGIYRRHLLETQSQIKERTLTEKDLQEADTIYLANAIRGLRRVTLERPD